MPKYWHSSAYNWEIVPHIGLLSVGFLFPSLKKKSEKIAKISTRAVVHKARDSPLHCTLSEIIVHLKVTKVSTVLQTLILRLA